MDGWLRAVLAMGLLMLAACDGARGEPPAAARPGSAAVDAAALRAAEWELTGFAAHDAAWRAYGQPLRLRFEEARVSGNAPCNAWSAEYKLGDDGALALGAMLQTKRACAALDLERVYVEALAATVRAAREDDNLRLLAADGSALVFRRVP